MEVPSNSTVRLRSALLRDRFPDPGGDAGLTLLVADAAGAVSMLTGRAIGVTGEGPFGCALEEVPAGLQPLASRIVTLIAERIYVLEGSRTVEEVIEEIEGDEENLASFTAGPYSESYFNPGQVGELKRLDQDAGRAALLWALATDCVRKGWMTLWYPDSVAAEPAPFSTLSEPNWFPEHSHPYPSYWDY